jgi:hypothetical protein
MNIKKIALGLSAAALSVLGFAGTASANETRILQEWRNTDIHRVEEFDGTRSRTGSFSSFDAYNNVGNKTESVWNNAGDIHKQEHYNEFGKTSTSETFQEDQSFWGTELTNTHIQQDVFELGNYGLGR